MNTPTIDALDDLLRLIDDKASDLMVLMGLNKVLDEHTKEEEYDCPITEK